MPDYTSSFPTLQTPRLSLRELLESDAAAIFTIHSDAAAMQWFGCDVMPDLVAASQLIEIFTNWRTMPNPGTRWGMEYQGHIVGSCGLFKWDKNWKSCHIGYELAKGHWGQGLMHEALLAILAWGFEHMALNRIQAQVHPQNTASIKSLESLGFVQEGCFRQAGFWHGQHHDLLQYALLKRDWQA